MEQPLPYVDTLLAAHRGQAVSAAAPPPDLASAMRVQRDVARALNAEVAGWKVGFSPDGVAVAGPLYASRITPSPARVPLSEAGIIVEIELAFRLGRDLPRKPYTREEILDAADEALIGIELVGPRLGAPPAIPYFALLADAIGNAGYVTGASSRAFRGLDLCAIEVRFIVDAEVVHQGRNVHPQGDPVEPLRAYASQPNDRLGGLRRGQVVTTGTLTKPLRLERGVHLQASLPGIGEVVLDLIR